MLDSLEFNKEIIALIRKHFPKAMQGDIEQNTAVASALATAMGGILAFAHRMNGQVIGRSVLETITHRIVEQAAAIDPKAGADIKKSLSVIHLH